MLWAISQMFYANLRIVAVPFAFGLAFLRLTDEGNGDDDDDDWDKTSDDAWQDDNPLHVPSTNWSADPPGRRRTIGFGAGYGPPEHTTPEHAPSVGFGAGWGAPKLIDGATSDPSQPGSTRPEW